MDDRARRILLGFALAGGALVLSASTAGAQSGSGGSDSAPKSATAADDGPGSGVAHSGCNGMGDMPDAGPASTATQAQLT